MPTYATIAQLRTYVQLDSAALGDTEATNLLAKAEGDIDSIANIDRPISAATGRRFAPAELSTVEALQLQRATCAQAEYRREMGNSFFVRGQFDKVSGPDFTTEGKLGAIGPQTWRELRANGFIRLTTTTRGGPLGTLREYEDFPERQPRTEFELG